MSKQLKHAKLNSEQTSKLENMNFYDIQIEFPENRGLGPASTVIALSRFIFYPDITYEITASYSSFVSRVKDEWQAFGTLFVLQRILERPNSRKRYFNLCIIYYSESLNQYTMKSMEVSLRDWIWVYVN